MMNLKLRVKKFRIVIICNVLEFDLGPNKTSLKIVRFSVDFRIERLGNAGKKRYRLSLRSR
jgi:hypothetical protein